jgi:hypothetical protein
MLDFDYFFGMQDVRTKDNDVNLAFIDSIVHGHGNLVTIVSPLFLFV